MLLFVSVSEQLGSEGVEVSMSCNARSERVREGVGKGPEETSIDISAGRYDSKSRLDKVLEPSACWEGTERH